jgi:hypothetical protein
MPNGWIENTSLGKICYTKMWLIVNLQKYFDIIVSNVNIFCLYEAKKFIKFIQSLFEKKDPARRMNAGTLKLKE